MSISACFKLITADTDFLAQNLMDVERREEWLKQYDYEVVINPKESPLQVKNYLVRYMSIKW